MSEQSRKAYSVMHDIHVKNLGVERDSQTIPTGPQFFKPTSAAFAKKKKTPKTSATTIGELLRQQLERDKHFYLFSPDETTSNRLSATYKVDARAWNLPHANWDMPELGRGRIVEMLAENVLFSTMTGHLLNGEQAMMTSYEAFFPIITSQLLQQVKFYTQSEKVDWRPKYPATNLLSTSTCWRQDHNGFTHQSPALISTLLSLPSRHTNCLFPVDAAAARAHFEYMLQSRNVVNLTTFNKTPEPQWLTLEQAQKQLKTGVIMVDKITAKSPAEFQLGSLALQNHFRMLQNSELDLVLTAAGDIMTREAFAAMEILREDLPGIKIRFVNIAALSYNAIGTVDSPLSQADFERYFTTDKPIIANFHGYPAALEQIFSRYTDAGRVSVHGFIDQGSTTTPFEMLSLNQASRYHLCIDAAQQLKQSALVEKYQKIIDENTNYAHEHGVDKIAL